MTDIIERLTSYGCDLCGPTRKEAAAKIERLQAELDKGAQCLSDYRASVAAAAVENGKLKDEIERLRADLQASDPTSS